LDDERNFPPSWPGLENIFPQIENRFAQRLPPHQASAFAKVSADRSARQAGFVSEGYVDPL
jgi:hypothetical protein